MNTVIFLIQISAGHYLSLTPCIFVIEGRTNMDLLVNWLIELIG